MIRLGVLIGDRISTGELYWLKVHCQNALETEIDDILLQFCLRGACTYCE